MINNKGKYLEFVKRLGKNISRVRKKRGYSIKELSQKTGFSENYLSRLEAGLTTRTSISRLVVVAQYLGVKLYTLF
ncbi:helix-turn-helix transcriptional regulator [bacterium]|nr:helix-turn-helix transcriptional regulator [bacterium]